MGNCKMCEPKDSGENKRLLWSDDRMKQKERKSRRKERGASWEVLQKPEPIAE